MLNIYRGDIRKRIGKIYPENNLMSIMNTQLYKKDAILVEISENKFIDVDDLLSDDKKTLKLYSFYIGEYYVDTKSLVNINEKRYVKRK